MVRIPKGAPPPDIAAIGSLGTCDVVARQGAKDVLLVAVGAMVAAAVDVAERLRDQGIGVTVIDPRWVKPLDPALVQATADYRLVVSVEDNGVVGGVGSMLRQAIADAGIATPTRCFGIPQEFIDHAERSAVLERVGLTPQALARAIVEEVTARTPHDGALLNIE